MDLEESVRRWVKTNLPHDPKPEVVTALDAMGPGALLAHYLNWRDRFVVAAPRQVLASSAYDENPLVRQRSTALAEIVRDIQDGADLTKYLSRRVKVGFDLQKKGAKKNLLKRQHLDLLLNEWGVHHLHVSTKVERDGFVERDGPLLFAVFKKANAYLIDVLDHDDFHNDRLLRVIIDMWPNEGLVTELKGVLGSRDKPRSQDERKGLRAVGLSSFYQHGDGRLFVAGGVGISSAGTSVKASTASGKILRTLAAFQKIAVEDPAQLSEILIRHGVQLPERFDFEFSFFADNGFGVVEKFTGASIGLGSA